MNLAVPTMFLLRDSPTVNALIVVVLCLLQLTSVKFVHPMRVADGRVFNMAMTALWLGAIAAMTELAPHLPLWGGILLVLGPLHQVLITARRTLRRPSASAATAVPD